MDQSDYSRHEKIRRRLLAQREQLEAASASHDRLGAAEGMHDSLQELSLYDNHPADIGTEMFERSKDLSLRDNFEVLKSQVDHALERLDRGLYGVCEVCGRPIEPERLEALPAATDCFRCRERQARDNTERHQNRPAEESVLMPPFSRTFLDHTDSVVSDGEDVWQKVARYGTSNSPQDVPDSVSPSDAYVNADEPAGIVEATDGLISLNPQHYPALENYGQHIEGRVDALEGADGPAGEDGEDVLEHIYPEPQERGGREPRQPRGRGRRSGLPPRGGEGEEQHRRRPGSH